MCNTSDAYQRVLAAKVENGQVITGPSCAGSEGCQKTCLFTDALKNMAPEKLERLQEKAARLSPGIGGTTAAA